MPRSTYEGGQGRRRKKRDVAERLYPAVQTGVDAVGRTVFFFGAVTDESVARAVVALEVLAWDMPKAPIRLILCSGGGSVDAGFTLYDAIRVCKAPVIVDCYGVAQSIAVLILQAASIRRVSPECRLMVHQGSVGVHDVPTKHLKDIAQEVQQLHDRYCEILAERSGMPLKKMAALCSQESFMGAEQAIEAGLADEVLGAHNPYDVVVAKQKGRRKR